MNSTIRKALALAVAATAFSAGSAQASTLVTVAEKDGISSTGLSVQAGDSVNIDATADQIWAGVWFTGNNGPAGWTQVANNPNYPLPTARKYSLLAAVGSQKVYIGSGRTFTATRSGTLYLQINDDVTGNGSGYFRAYAEVN